MLIGSSVEAAEPADISAGKAIADAQCVGCHGVDGRGAAPGIPNLAAQVDMYLVESLLAYKAEKRMHAALKDMTTQLSSADIHNVVGYYASLPPLKEIAEMRPQDVRSPYEKGEAFAEACARCHGEDGNSTTPGIPSLAGQQPLYFVAAVRAYLDGTRSKATMEMLRELSHVDLESLSLFYASQAPARREPPAFGDPAAGEPLTARCGGCHGAHGVSNDAATPSLAGQDAQYLVEAIKAYRGRVRQHDVMLAENTDDEIEHIAAFYSVQESRPAAGGPTTVQELVEKCDRCHGPGIKHPTMAVPKIGGQDRDYLIRALRMYRDGKRGSSLMHNMSLPYSEAIIDSVASLYASRPAR
jgi:cytochrome c553